MKTCPKDMLGKLQRFEVYSGVRIIHHIFGQVYPVHNAIQSESMSLGECSSIVTVPTTALRIEGEFVDNFTEFMTNCDNSAFTMGIESLAVPQDLAIRVNRGIRVDWELMMSLITTIDIVFGPRCITLQ